MKSYVLLVALGSKFICSRSFLDHESQIQIYMTDLLEEMKKLNETFNADIEGIGL